MYLEEPRKEIVDRKKSLHEPLPLTFDSHPLLRLRKSQPYPSGH